MSTQKEKIINQALSILEGEPNGIRSTKFQNAIQLALPDVPLNTIDGTIWDLDKKLEGVAKPERGLFILIKYLSEDKQAELLVKKDTGKVAEVLKKINGNNNVEEKLFYEPFAEYLKNDLEECTKSITLGGNKFGDKWGTPDVLGVYKFSDADPIRPQPEIISAEIKTDTNQLITAFGQACSYKLFSHKVYLVIPKEAEKDIGRVESLCLKFGIGLILFDKNDHQNPNFEIRTRATKNEPDYFYINDYMRKIRDEFDKLF